MKSIAVYHVASLLIYGLYKTLRLIHVRIEGSHHTNVDYIFDASEKTDVLIRSFVQIYKEMCVEDIVSLYIFSPGEDEKPELLSRYQLSGKKEVYLNEFLIESHYRRFYSEAVEHIKTCLETEKEISSYAPAQQLSLRRHLSRYISFGTNCFFV